MPATAESNGTTSGFLDTSTTMKRRVMRIGVKINEFIEFLKVRLNIP
jgi:hypothetical protein